MALQTPIPIFRSSRLMFVYNSLVQGNTADTAAVQLHQSFQDALRAFYGPNRPVCSQLGIDLQTVGALTASYANLAGYFDPEILFIDGTPNDLGVTQGTLDALWAKIVDTTQYRNAKLPRAVIWMSLNWRNDESSGGTNQAQIQTDHALAATRTAATNATIATAAGTNGGTRFLDCWALWNRTRLVDNPNNVGTGIYTMSGDGTHVTQLGSDLYRDGLLGTGKALPQIVTTNGQTGVVTFV